MQHPIIFTMLLLCVIGCIVSIFITMTSNKHPIEQAINTYLTMVITIPIMFLASIGMYAAY